jgi:hypothetical protein
VDYDIDLKANRDAIIADAVAAADDPARLDHFNQFPLGAKSGFSYSDYGTVLTLRAIATIVKRRYGVEMPSRGSIVRGVIQGLGDASPFCVLRRDIRSFYESVPTGQVKTELLVRSILPARIHRYLERFFDLHCPSPHGLPRGLSLSAVLAEWIMRDFDKAVWAIPGVVRYYRFSDDILVFSTAEMAEVCHSVESALPSGLEFSESKSHNVHFSVSKDEPTTNREFEYLGYRFSAPTGSINTKKSRRVSVSIAQRKLDRAKSRLIVSAKELLRTGDGDTFLKRVRFFTGNYRIWRANPLLTTGQRTIKSGIYFNYRHCGEYRNGDMHPPVGITNGWSRSASGSSG